MLRLILFLMPAALFAAEQRFARLGEFEGKVEVQLTAADPWVAAERNLPLMESTWLRTGTASRLEIELDEGSAWRLGPESQSEISDYKRLSTGQRITLLSLDKGIAYFTGMAEGAGALMLAVPGAQITVTRGARVRLEAREQWSQIAVIEGIVRFASAAAELDLREGQATRVEPSNPARFFLDREVAGLDLDRWSEERDKALASSTSAAHVSQRYGLTDLDAAGEWIESRDLGAVWKPKAAEGWTPFRSGRWRWYQSLGYTWVSDEPWGWLPYHYGRWTRHSGLGWVWAPSPRPVFKPGDVYWLRGSGLAGWGPLGPGEAWPAPGNAQPRQYLEANTMWAAFQQDTTTIDPSGFTARPKEPLLAAAFTIALPSPALPASRLEALRPVRRAGRLRIAPTMEPVTSGAPPPPADVPPPVVVTDTPIPAPVPPPDVVYAPPVIVPVPNILIVTPPTFPDYSRRSRGWGSSQSSSTNKPQPSAPPPPAPAAKRPAPSSPNPPAQAESSTPPKHERPPLDSNRVPAPPANPAPQQPRTDGPNKGERPSTLPPAKKFRDSGELQIVNEAAKHISERNYAQALVSLDKWNVKYHKSDFADDRAYYYMQTYAGLNQPVKVLETGSPLVAKDVASTFRDPLQLIGVLYLASDSFQKLAHPTREQVATGLRAARELLGYIPACFAAQNRPQPVSEADWNSARAKIENLARQTLALAEPKLAVHR